MKYRHLLILAVIASATACSKNATVKPEEVVATVNGQQISKKEFDQFVTLVSNGSTTADKLTAEQRTQVVERLISMHAAADEAVKAKLDSAADVVPQLNLYRVNVLSDAMIKEKTEKAAVTDAEIQSEYDTQVAAMPREYHASHILVKTKEEADKVLAELGKGGDFEALAKKYSQDPGSAKQGGDLGWFSPSSMVAEFGAAVTALQNGQTTAAPVQTQYGFHIIKLHESRAPTPPALADVKTQVETIVKNKKVAKYLEEARKAAKVEMGPAATVSAAASSAAASEPAATTTK